MVEKYIMPCRIVLAENADGVERLLEEKPLQTNFTVDDCAVIRRGGFVLVDFGKELCGGVAAAVQKTANFPDCAKCRLVFGESVMEALSTLGYKNATNNHSVRDTVVEVSSMSTFRFGNTGFRFVKLEAVDADIFIKSLKAQIDIRELEYKGSFECDDELINRIWKTGAYTVQLNMQEYLWDGIKRDRLVWVGDMHPEVSTILSVFGDNEIIPQSLDFSSRCTPADKWMNGMPSYNFWWLKIQLDYYAWTGNYEYLKKQESYIYEMCEYVLSMINKDGTHNIENMFVEWNSRDTEYEAAGFQAMMIVGLKSVAELCHILGNAELFKRCKIATEQVKKHIYPYEGNKQIAAMLSLAEMVDADRISNNVIKPKGAEGLSTFWGYYTLQALAKSGDYGAALEIIRKYWGKMLELGATTFWEDFDINWAENAGRIDEIVPKGKKDIHGDFGKHCYKGYRHSLCHGWASGPTAFLSQYILGIYIKEAGCKEVEIRPALNGLKCVKGKFPTPYGEICVEHSEMNGKIKSKVSAPNEIKIIL